MRKGVVKPAACGANLLASQAAESRSSLGCGTLYGLGIRSSDHSEMAAISALIDPDDRSICLKNSSGFPTEQKGTY